MIYLCGYFWVHLVLDPLVLPDLDTCFFSQVQKVFSISTSNSIGLNLVTQNQRQMQVRASSLLSNCYCPDWGNVGTQQTKAGALRDLVSPGSTLIWDMISTWVLGVALLCWLHFFPGMHSFLNAGLGLQRWCHTTELPCPLSSMHRLAWDSWAGSDYFHTGQRQGWSLNWIISFQMFALSLFSGE